MKSCGLFVTLFLFSVVNAATLPQGMLQASLIPSALNDALVEEVNGKATTWKAGRNDVFEGRNIEELKKLLGVPLGWKNSGKFPKVSHNVANTPSNFDSRKQWPGCIGPILNQGSCGSCWAFGAAETASDRLCINGGNDASFKQLAPLDLVTCDNYDNGCFGGNLESAFDYVQSAGLASEECLPYLQSQGGPVGTCPVSQQPCTNFQQTPSCPSQCHDGSSISRTSLSNVYSAEGAENIAAEIAKNGPVETAFTVYEDFVHYKSGVYKHTSGSALGGHAVKIIGFGEENGEKYWLCQNSWTTSWGDGGYFKIAFEECGIDDYVVTAKP